MEIGSLFAGIGGFDLAAERVGMTVAWQSENDVKASAVLAHHWPKVPNFGDIYDIGGVRLEAGGSPTRQGATTEGASLSAGRGRGSDERHAPNGADSGGTDDRTPAAVDVLTGGFPCQDYSVAGNREGLAGDRGALWWQFHRLIDSIRPTWVVAENVPGLISSRDGQDFETIIRSFTELGYGITWAVLDAQYFGVAQRRRRVFIVGHIGGKPRPEILALSEGLYGHTPPSRTEGKGATADVAGSLNAGEWRGPNRNQIGTIVFSPIDDGRDATHDLNPTIRVGSATGGNPPAVAFAQNQRDEIRDLRDKAGALAAEPGVKQQTYVMSVRGRDGGANLELEEELSPALRGGNDSQTGEYSQRIWDGPTVRRLTPLECERLQGFPDGWTNTPNNSDTQRYRQLGNAVAVPVVEWILSRIAAA